jgi:hypothetical protein
MTSLSILLWIVAILVANAMIGAYAIGYHLEWEGTIEEPVPSGFLWEWLEQHDDIMLLFFVEIWPVTLLAYYIEKQKGNAQ